MIHLDDLAPEEREYITQVGKISRPFLQDHSNAIKINNLITRLLPIISRVWEVCGVDVSVWQGDIDFSALSEKAKFVIIRYGIGNNFVDTKAQRNVNECIRLNLPYGGYWYLKPEKDWFKHAESFANVVLDFGSIIYPTSDFEESGGLQKQALDNWLQKYFNTLFSILSNRGFWSDTNQHMWYSSKNIVDKLLPKPNGWMRHSQLDVAHWTNAEFPLIPYEWEVANKTFKFWQYAVVDSAGYGVESNKIDLQRYNGTLDQFNEEFNVNIIPPEEPPEIPTKYVIPICNLNTRTSPIIDPNNIIGVATPQDKFEYIGEEGDWTVAKVYLKSQYLRKE